MRQELEINTSFVKRCRYTAGSTRRIYLLLAHAVAARCRKTIEELERKCWWRHRYLCVCIDEGEKRARRSRVLLSHSMVIHRCLSAILKPRRKSRQGGVGVSGAACCARERRHRGIPAFRSATWGFRTWFLALNRDSDLTTVVYGLCCHHATLFLLWWGCQTASKKNCYFSHIHKGIRDRRYAV